MFPGPAQLSVASSTVKWRKAGRGLGTRLVSERTCMFLGEIIYKIYFMSFHMHAGLLPVSSCMLPETTADREAENESVSQCDTC